MTQAFAIQADTPPGERAQDALIPACLQIIAAADPLLHPPAGLRVLRINPVGRGATDPNMPTLVGVDPRAD
jgi:hypothetical protein